MESGVHSDVAKHFSIYITMHACTPDGIDVLSSFQSKKICQTTCPDCIITFLLVNTC